MTQIQFRRVMLLISALLLVAFGFILGTAVLSTVAANTAPAFQASADTLNAQTATLEFRDSSEAVFSNIYETVAPSVVSINVVARSGMGVDDAELEAGTGTGFVIDDQGHIVTNNHVVLDANRIEINFFDGTIVRGEIVGTDPNSDLAVVKVDLPAEQLHPVAFASSDNLFVGQNVVAIGSPFGQSWTMTTGIISAVDRTISGLAGYQIGAVIQTDAAINPGNSGGPLLDLDGNVIGVNSQIISQTRSSAGVGFSIPSNLVQRVAEALINEGRVAYSYLGIESRPGDIDLAVIEAMSLPNNLRGVVVTGVTANGPAQQAGLREAENFVNVDGIPAPGRADIITQIDGQTVTGLNSVIAYLAANTEPGQTVSLTVLRDGQYVNIPLTLGSRPDLR